MTDEIITTMQALADDGWCVVLKRLPKELGWIIQGSRSEYDAPQEDQTIGDGKWCCEAQSMRHDGPYRHDQWCMHKNPLKAIRAVARGCRRENKRVCGRTPL